MQLQNILVKIFFFNFKSNAKAHFERKLMPKERLITICTDSYLSDTWFR